jgi:hypothetical protein
MKDEAVLKTREKGIIKQETYGNEEYLCIWKVKSGYA